MTVLSQVFEHIDQNKDAHIKSLSDAVAIPSVSAWVTHRGHSLKCAQFFSDRLQALGFSTELRSPPIQHKVEGQIVELPPVILARSANEDPSKKTLLIYGHIDVQPAEKSDGWNTEPFDLTERDGKLFGRGATDDKGPVLAWTNAIEAFQKVGNNPVNARFILEGMEESGSVGLEELLNDMKAKKDSFLQGIDYCVISDSYWLGDTRPCIAYGLRGAIYFLIEIECANQDLHSGCCGSLVHEAMSDLVWMLSQLTDVQGEILVPGIMEKVRALSKEEAATYQGIDFDIPKRRTEMGAPMFIHEKDPARTLQGIWRYPCLSIHGIEGAFSEKGFKTVIPGKAVGKFSIRTVPDMTSEDTQKKVLDYLNDLWKKRGSPNRAVFSSPDAGNWYYADPNSPNYMAARRAMQTVYNVAPNLIREGGSIPITLVLSECTGKDVCLLPIGCSNDGAHSQNEKINVDNYVMGAKVMAAYMQELSDIKP
ncbi:cytosolic non-specific dipeptidase-like [Condylostylus longicornis]|uniref:cytosolic non-specific dipeptidase-like n=1 Tax=Condylostylus longicornis TaxID=2530218 RepID=UPI00244E05E4|nr:cytosolic non-specific dipeptidase-like [Condylostylus longicornis]